MSFANTTANSEWSVNSGKAYISTGPFKTAFYSYNAAQNASLVTVGTLSLITNTDLQCPSGRILALNGRKLTPGVNPINFITATFGASPTATTPRLYLGVADLVTGLNGFIDPTNVLFAPYDKNRPVGDYLVDMAAGLTTNQALSQNDSGSSANILTRSAGVLPPTGTVANGGTVAALSSACGTVNMASVAGAATGTVLVTGTLITPTSIILLTSEVIGCVPYLTTTGSGTFTISVVNTTGGALAPMVNFLIIN